MKIMPYCCVRMNNRFTAFKFRRIPFRDEKG